MTAISEPTTASAATIRPSRAWPLPGVAGGVLGGVTVDSLVVERITRRPRPGGEDLEALSEREREILALMAEGLSNVAVSEQLHLAERTVEAHIRSIFHKLGLPAQPDVNRRVLAVLTLLRS